MNVLPAYMWGAQRAQKRDDTLELELKVVVGHRDGGRGCWETNLGHLEDH